MQHVTIPDTEVHTLHSEHVGADFELWIARPQAGFAPIPEGPVDVLYVLDANLFFGTAVEMTRLMHKLFGELPPLLVVGIAYPTDNGFLQSILRTRDFTPSADPGMAAMSANIPQPPNMPSVEPAMGGADAFLQFLTTEVKPFVATRHHVRENGTTLFGSSLGGLFVTHALLTSPTAFQNYIAVSPALWWDDADIFQVEPDWTALSPAQPTNVFFAAGELEENPNIPNLAAFKMITHARQMAEHLSDDAIPLTVYFEEIAQETHTSVVPVALTRGLRRVLARPMPVPPGR